MPGFSASNCSSCIVLQCVAVCYRVLQCVAENISTPTWKHAGVLRFKLLRLQRVVVCRSVSQHVVVCRSKYTHTNMKTCWDSPLPTAQAALCCSVLQCVTVCRSMLLCVAVNIRTPTQKYAGVLRFPLLKLRCVAVCCSVLQRVTVCRSKYTHTNMKICWDSPLPTAQAAVCCSAFQCVAVCCSVLQCVAVNIHTPT